MRRERVKLNARNKIGRFLLGTLLALSVTVAGRADVIDKTFTEAVTFVAQGTGVFGHAPDTIDLPLTMSYGPTTLNFGPGFAPDYLGGEGGAASLTSSGTFGIDFKLGANGGGTVDSNVQASYTVNAPQGPVSAGQNFSVSAQGSVTGGTFTVHGPSASLGMNLVANFQNTLSGEVCLVPYVSDACLEGSTSLNFAPNGGTIPIWNIDTGAGTITFYGAATLPLPAYNAPFNIKSGPSVVPFAVDPSVTIGQLQLGKAQDETLTGFQLFGPSLDFDTTEQKMLSLSASIPGLLQLGLTGINLGILQNNFGIPGVASMSYTLFDSEIGTSLGLSQDFGFNAEPDVQLKFSTGVTEQVTEYQWQDCGFLGFDCFFGGPGTTIITTSANNPCAFLDVCNSQGTILEPAQDIPSGIVTLAPGQTLNLTLDHDGKLDSISYLLGNPTLSNVTNLDVNPFISFSALCGSITIVDVYTSGNTCVYQNSLDLTSRDPSYQIYSGSVPVDFNAVTVNVPANGPLPNGADLNGGGSDGSDPLATPEPSSFVSLATGLLLMALLYSKRVARKSIESATRE